MRKGIAAAAAAGALVLTSCSTATETSTSQTTATTRATLTAPAIPSPDAAQQRALLAALRQIDSGLDDERSVDRARNTCQTIRSGEAPAVVARNTKMRFEGGAVPTLSEPQVAAIVAAIRSTFCL